MIDEYVKKHYGDLERGVLAPEVKYKVLFKIYRKKYRKEKARVKILSDVVCSWHVENDSEGNIPCSDCEHYVPMHPEGLSIIPASCKLGKSMTACCPFYSVKVDGKKAQKEMFDLHEVCSNCIHFRKGKGKNKSTCAKHDKFVTETCSCYEFEDKDKTQGSYLDWLHDDITWCCRECDDMDCERNLMNRKMTTGFISMADMFDPFKCPVDAEMPEARK